MSTFIPTPFAMPLLTHPPHIDSDGRLATSVACLDCAYDLRGIEIDAACPECGTKVRVTLRGDKLAEGPAAWLRTLRRGAGVLRVGVALSPLMVGVPIAMVGVWLLTTPQPDRDEPAGDERFRWASRTLMATGTLTLVALASGAGYILATQPRNLLTTLGGYADILGIAGGGLFILGFLAGTVYFDTLAQRIPNAALHAEIRRRRGRWLAGLCVLMLIALATNVANRLYVAGAVPNYAWAAPAFGSAVCATLLWLWVETLRLANALRRGLQAVSR